MSERASPAGWSQALRTKAEPRLKHAFDELGPEPSVGLPVVVVLKPQAQPRPSAKQGDGRFDHVSTALDFEVETQSLVTALHDIGASGIRLDWIGRSLVLKATPVVLEAVAAHDEVRQIVLDDRHKAMT